jgi:hypothetical protein
MFMSFGQFRNLWMRTVLSIPNTDSWLMTTLHIGISLNIISTMEGRHGEGRRITL